MNKPIILVFIALLVFAFTNCTKCDCEICCEFSTDQLCETTADVKKDECTVEKALETGDYTSDQAKVYQNACTAACK
jgi:hypothetical protein